MTHGTLGPQWIDDEIGKANAMSEAPERIFAWVYDEWKSAWNVDPEESAPDATLYVRADLYDAQAKVIEAAKELSAAQNSHRAIEDTSATTPKQRMDAYFRLSCAWDDLRATLAALQESNHD